ncbi:MAG: glycine betaine/L-proline ABC transporter ATP-binding protein [Rhodobacteraceae bacterium]|nr:glycine betaine/L-proline ABC transporter ATP-binding protein [Paracoccaceae bacterium]
MASHGIEIKDLYKIFGPRGEKYIEAVQNGMSKTELNEEHGHVLGLKDINISMPAGKIQVVMGLSGSGKSTLIRHINRLIDPTAGSVHYEGVDVCQMSKKDLQEFRRHKTAMVFQKFALLPHKTVVENTVYGLQIQGVDKGEAKKRALKWIDRVGLSGFEDHFPNQLSGGMQQRVGLARALTNDADILLMDEAFSALDPLIRTDMQSVLLDIQEELRKTIVFITHDLDEALRLGDRIAILRDGEVIQQGSGQEIVLNPADAYIADFIKEVNRGRVISVETIMNKTPIEGTVKIVLNASDMLETAAQAMAQGQETVANVCDDSQNLIGSINLKETINAMVTAAKH